MSDFPEFATMADLNTWWTTTHLPILQTNGTNFPSEFTGVLSVSQVLSQVINCSSFEEGSSIISSYMIKNLRGAVPAKIQLWSMQSKFISHSQTFFTDGGAAELDQIYDGYLEAGSKCEDPAIIENYQNVATKWRKHMGDLLITGMETLTESVETLLPVNPANVSSLIKMIEIMNENNPTIKRSKGEPGHVASALEFFSNDDMDVPSSFDIDKRTDNSSDAYIWENGAVIKSGTGTLLLSTALAYMLQKDPSSIVTTKIDSFITKIAQRITDKKIVYDSQLIKLQHLQIAKEEAIVMLNASVNVTDAFTQQMSDIDTLFVAHYWMFNLATVASVLEFRNVGTYFFNIGCQPRGAKIIREDMTKSRNTQIRRLVMKMSKSSELYLPPFVLNANRIQDLIASVGAIKWDSIESLKCPTPSWQHVLNLKLSSNHAVAMVTNMFALESVLFTKFAPQNGKKIYHSVHLLHQLLLNKKSPFQNTFNVTLNVRISM